jgi:hypothetical protein
MTPASLRAREVSDQSRERGHAAWRDRENPRSRLRRPGQQVNLDITHYDRMNEDQLREIIAAQLNTIRLLDGGGTEH